MEIYYEKIYYGNILKVVMTITNPLLYWMLNSAALMSAGTKLVLSQAQS